MRLSSGRLEITVPKLEPGHSFIVETPHAEVRVRGTQFTVEVLRGDATELGITRVSVAHGLVEVWSRGTRRLLNTGEHWASPGGVKASSSSSGVTQSPTAAPGGPVETLQAEGPAPAPAAELRSSERRASEVERTRSPTLAKQNQLLESAINAKKRGDDPRAVRLLEELLRRHAASPLAESAQVERFRALRRLGRHTEAAREARRYLASHSEGFARDEAREVALAPAAAASAPSDR